MIKVLGLFDDNKNNNKYKNKNKDKGLRKNFRIINVCVGSYTLNSEPDPSSVAYLNLGTVCRVRGSLPDVKP